MIKKIDHFVLTTADISSCISFYEALGFQARQAGSRWELFAGDFKINVHLLGQELEPRAAFVRTGSADFCLELDMPLELCRQSLCSKGLVPETGIVSRHGVCGEMHSFYLRDPDGNLVELCSYEV